MPSHVHERAASTLLKELSRIISFEVRDPHAALIRVTKVELSPDKRQARVLVAFWDPDTRTDPDNGPLEALERATPFIRKALARSLRMRHVPELNFDFDLSEEHAKRIDTLLKRIEKRSRKGSLTVLLAIALQGFATTSVAALERLESSAAVMGSEFRIACYAETKKQAAGAITAAFDEVRRIDNFLSHYKPDSELSRVNSEAAREVVEISAELTGLLARCQRYSEASEGAFDITVGALVDAWGFYKGEGAMPSAWALWRARRNIGFQHVEIDQARHTVRFLRSGVRLDPGGIGKGYAVDRAVSALREYGITSALVSSGTSSIYALGAPPGEAGGWHLDLRGAGKQASIATTVLLRDQGLSTSGSYEKFFVKGGKRYGHILDPRTGRPVTGMNAVSVIAPNTIDTEAWSTALFVNGAAWARRHGIPGARVYLCPEDSACGWLDRD